MKSGFSLIEILIVIGILGALLAGTFALVNKLTKARKMTTTETRLGTLEANIEDYHSRIGQYPEDLNNLVVGPSGELAKKWTGAPFAQESDLKDGWGQDFVYELNKSGYPPYSLYSPGIPGINKPIYAKGSQGA